MREAFESWWKREFGETFNDLTRADDNYVYASVQRTWRIWQAAWDAKDVNDDERE